MKKIIAIGDIHGRDIWEQIPDVFDQENIVVFVGDYFDTRDGISPEKQLRNFQSIVAFKKNNLDRVHLLIGNHDFHYMNGRGRDRYSGFQEYAFIEIHEALEKANNEGLLEICYRHDKILFTHAGITETWAKNWNVSVDAPDIEKSMWGLFNFKPEAFRFQIGAIDPSGDDVIQSPIWVRPDSLQEDNLKGYSQVVGHTMQVRISNRTGANNPMGIYSALTFIDALHRKEYLEIELPDLVAHIKDIK